MIEKLEKEAEEYSKKATAWLEDREPLSQRDIKIAYLVGAEPREKQIKKLEQQIKQMKYDVIEHFGSEYNILVAKLLNKWEIKE